MVVRRGRDQVGVDPGVGQCFDKASRDQAVDFFVGVMGSVVNGETIEEAQGGRVQQYAILDDCVGCKVEDVGEWFGHDGRVVHSWSEPRKFLVSSSIGGPGPQESERAF